MAGDQNLSTAKDTGGIVMCCLFIVLAAISLWDTTHMLDSDSYVFPRAIAIALIVLCIMLIVWNLVRPSAAAEQTAQKGSTVRRTLLVAVMLLSCFVMPWLGFLISGIITFGVLMMVAMYDQWTPQKRIIYPVVSVVIVLGFYTLFSKLLLVPLPMGVLFE